MRGPRASDRSSRSDSFFFGGCLDSLFEQSDEARLGLGLAVVPMADGEDDDEDDGDDDAGDDELDLHVLVPHPAADARALGPEIQGVVVELLTSSG